MKKLFNLLLALVLVLSMCSLTAFAADEAETHPLEDSKIVKELKVADGIDISDVSNFTFSFTAVETDSAAEADHPDIDEQEITVGDIEDGLATGELALSDLFSDDDFPHAGEYQYTVVETTEGFDEDGLTLTVDESEYTLRIYVINGTDGPEVIGITVENEDGEKVDPTADEFKFENEYKEVIDDESGVLTVNKSITGDYADKTKEFPITVEITIPELASTDDVELEEGEVEWAEKVGTVTADLSDGGSIVFTKLPAGTTYVVKETQDDLYKSKVTGDVAEEDTELKEGDVEKEGSGPVVEAGNEVNIENNREDIIPTGLIMRTMPYAILVLGAAFGLAYLLLKKRNYND